VLCGGRAPDDPWLRSGACLLATVLGDVANAMRVAQEEISGPVTYVGLAAFRSSAPSSIFSVVSREGFGTVILFEAGGIDFCGLGGYIMFVGSMSQGSKWG